MKNYFLLAFLLATNFSFAQLKDKKIFLDSLNKETTTGNPKYYRIIKDYNLNKVQYEISDYYLNDQIKSEGIFIHRDGHSPIGQHKEYYSSGKLKSDKNYSLDLSPTGIFSSFYENGNKEIEGEYVKIKTDVVKEHTVLKVTSYWDEKGNQKVNDGNGFMIEKSESETSRGKIINGFKNGTWSGVNLKDKIQFVDQYESGIFIAGVSKDDNNTEYGYLEISKQPEFQGGPLGFTAYVIKNYRTPIITKSIKGRIFIEFTIGIEGQIQDVEIKKGLQEDLDREALRMINTTNYLWTPGEYRGVKTKVKYSLPLMLDIKTD